jgi:hypothetical protein
MFSWSVFWAVLAALFVYDTARRARKWNWRGPGVRVWDWLRLLGAFFLFGVYAVAGIGAIISMFSLRFHAWFVPLLEKLVGN